MRFSYLAGRKRYYSVLHVTTGIIPSNRLRWLFSQTQFVSTYASASQYSADLQLYLCVQVSSLIYYGLHTMFSWSTWTFTFISLLWESPGLCLSSYSAGVQTPLLKAVPYSNRRVHPICFLSLRDHHLLLPDVQ